MHTHTKQKNPRFTKLVTSIALALACGAANADGWYAGAGGGQSKMKEPAKALAGTSFDDKDSAWKGFVGYQFQEPVALELSYVDFGQFVGSGVAASDVFDATGATLSVLGGVPFNRTFSLIGRAGVTRWDVDDVYAVPGNSGAPSASGTSFSFGAGAQIDFTRLFGLRVEWERFRDVGEDDTTGESDVDLMSASLVFRFK